MQPPSSTNSDGTVDIRADLATHSPHEPSSADKTVKHVTRDDAAANARISQLSDKTNSSLDIKEMELEPIEQTWKPKTSELMIMVTMAVSSLIVVSRLCYSNDNDNN